MAPLVVQIVSTLLARRRTELARHWKCGQRATESAPEPLDTAILVAGGQAPMFTFDTAETLQTRFVEFYERGKLSVALCHGVAILKYARLPNGEHLAKGKTVTGFANVEEDFADNAVWDMNLLPRDKHVMPWRIEDEMKSVGANYVQAGLWRPFAIRDGNLITGQQNFSGTATAALLVEALGR
jgi:putative intracellular protease/amidase